MAPTVTDFWANVARGQDCISAIPSSRRPLDHFYEPDPKAPGKTYSKWMGVLEDIDKFDPLFFSLLCGIVADQDLDHKLEHILRALKQHNIVLPDTPITRVKGLFQVFNANNQMKYVPEGPINAGITLFKASDLQPRVLDNEHFRQGIDAPAVLVRIEAMNRTWSQFNERASRAREDVHLGWDRYTTAAVTAYDVPGDHMNFIRDPHTQALARAMRACLAG